MGAVAFVGRVLFALLFIAAGAQKLQTYDAKGGPMVNFMAPKLDGALRTLKGYGVDVPLTRDQYPFLLLGVAVTEVLGGILFILDSGLGATLLLGFLLPTTAIMHDFWNVRDKEAAQIEQIMFMKNVCLIGALLLYLGTPRARAAAVGADKKRQ